MALTEFGKAVRKARIDTGTTLTAMSEALKVSPAFLSALETGRKKIPKEWVSKIFDYFFTSGVKIDCLGEYADISNKSVSIEGLSPDQQMLIAGFARSSLDAETINNLAELMGAVSSRDKKQ